MSLKRADLLYTIYGLFIFLFIGLFWWSLPYSELDMGSAFVRWSLVILVASFIFQLFFELIFKKLVISAVISITAVIVVRVIIDMYDDPSTHNLLLLEVLIAAFIAVISSTAGLFFANLINQKSDKEPFGKSEIDHSRKNTKRNKTS